ncbi:MAG TPA: hypothetical protein VFC78_15265 [Tepidisphaeraceae bacterium]|nr:hypothetical protein [Tepidisphaeraceae bacterium]
MQLQAPERGIEAHNLIARTMDRGAVGQLDDPSGLEADKQASPSQLASLQADILELRAELERLRAERGKLADRQTRLMELLGTTHMDHLVHDLRNVLNERNLLRVLADSQQ